MTIRFHSDSSVTGRGFRAVYSQITGCDGGDSCCSSDNMCGDGEGDCDHDGDCLSGVCGTDNCVGEGFDSTDDCCIGPFPTTTTTTTTTTTGLYPKC